MSVSPILFSSVFITLRCVDGPTIFFFFMMQKSCRVDCSSLHRPDTFEFEMRMGKEPEGARNWLLGFLVSLVCFVSCYRSEARSKLTSTRVRSDRSSIGFRWLTLPLYKLFIVVFAIFSAAEQKDDLWISLPCAVMRELKLWEQIYEWEQKQKPHTQCVGV